MKRSILSLFLLMIVSQGIFAQYNKETAKKYGTEAIEAFKKNDYKLALEKFEKFETYGGETEKGYYYKTLCNYNLKDIKNAKQCLDKYLTFNPSGGDYNEIMGIAGNINSKYNSIIKEETDYKYASESNNHVVKIKFLKDYPSSKYKTTIENQLDEVLWKKVKEGEKTFDLQNYLEYLPNGKHAKKAKEYLAFKNAREKDNYIIWENFKEDYPYADSIKIADKKLKKAYLTNAEINLSDENNSSAVFYANLYQKAFPYGEHKGTINNIKQEAYYKIAEKYNIQGSKSNAITNYNNCIETNQYGTYSEKARQRLNEYRIADLTAEKQEYYLSAKKYRRTANKSLAGGLFWTSFSLASAGGAYYFVDQGNEDIMWYAVGAGVAFVSMGISLSLNKYKDSSYWRNLHREEKRKYKSIQVSLSPANYPSENNALGLCLNLKF